MFPFFLEFYLVYAGNEKSERKYKWRVNWAIALNVLGLIAGLTIIGLILFHFYEAAILAWQRKARRDMRNMADWG